MFFSDKIKRLRIESGKLQKDLAKAIGVDVPAYSRYEHGERRPKREQVIRLARIFKVDSDELVAAWLADEAYSHIANDKLAPRAAAMLQSMLGEDGSEQPQATEIAEPSTTLKDNPERTMVAQLGRSRLPHFEQGDAATVMSRIEDESIDCIVTTPPYWRRRTQGTESITATNAIDFVNELLEAMAQAWRVLKPQGSLWLNMGDDTTDGFVQGIPWRVVLAMIDQQGWHLVNEVVWNKMGRNKSSRVKDKAQGIVPGDVWTIGVQRSGIAHYCVAPDTLYRLPITATCPRDGIVLDPYCGTGTACRIAYEMNRRSIGIDINKKYIDQARASIEQKPLSLF